MKQLPYGVQTEKKFVQAAIKWCAEQFGDRWEVIGHPEGTWTVFWAGRGIPGHYQWWFETEEQQLLFTLKWS